MEGYLITVTRKMLPCCAPTFLLRFASLLFYPVYLCVSGLAHFLLFGPVCAVRSPSVSTVQSPDILSSGIKVNPHIKENPHIYHILCCIFAPHLGLRPIWALFKAQSSPFFRAERAPLPGRLSSVGETRRKRDTKKAPVLGCATSS